MKHVNALLQFSTCAKYLFLLCHFISNKIELSTFRTLIGKKYVRTRPEIETEYYTTTLFRFYGDMQIVPMEMLECLASLI